MVKDRIGKRIAGFLYPREAVCIGCGALRVDHAQWSLCAHCEELLVPLEGPFCPRCGAAGWSMLCLDCHVKAPDAISARYFGYAYEGMGGTLVRALKYQGVYHAAFALADQMAEVIAGAVSAGEVDALVPVPLHRARERVRGFNQAMALSQEIERRLGVRVISAIGRSRKTRMQAMLSSEQRAQNVRGAFEITAPVEGLSLILVDDVLTTGATAIACAEALLEAGARRVSLVTATRALEGDADA